MLLAAAVFSAVLSACGTEMTASDPAGPSSAADDAPFVVADGEGMVAERGGELAAEGERVRLRVVGPEAVAGREDPAERAQN